MKGYWKNWGKTTFAWQWHSGSLLLLNIGGSPTRSCFLMLAHHPQRTVWLPRSLPHHTTYSLGQSETTRGLTSKTTHIQANWEDRVWCSAELWVRGFWSVRKSKCRERSKIWILRRRRRCCGVGKVKQTWLRTWRKRVCLDWLEIFQLHQMCRI